MCQQVHTHNKPNVARQDQYHRACTGMLCSHLTGEEPLGVSPLLSGARGSASWTLQPTGEWWAEGAAADTVQALVLCAFNTFSFPLCSLNKKKLFCKATFCSFLPSLCIYHVFNFFSEEEVSESVSSNSIRCLLRPLWP